MMRDSMEAAGFAVRAFPISLLVLAAGSCAITWGTPYFPLIASWALVLTLVVLTLMAARPALVTVPPRVNPAGFAAWVQALGAGALLLLIPVFVVVRPNEGLTIREWTYPFLDKRWVVALYGVGLITVFVLPTWFYQRLVAVEAAVANDESRPRWSVRAAGALVVVALAWFAAGPPWHVERHHRAIDFHEQVHLGPLQAIHKGEMPFIGPAATQYGPGSQWVTYNYMTRTGRFTVVGFREANLLFHVTALAAAGLLALWLIDLPSAVLVMILALAFSPATFFTPAPDGTFQGAYGWGNAWRYLGAVLIVPGAVLAAMRVRDATRISLAHVGFGVAWGVFAWISQENFTATATAGGLSVLLLVLTQTIRMRHAVTVGVSMLIGFAVFWVPLLVVYAAYGHAGEFVRNYFHVARAVAMGFSNAWWAEGTTNPGYLAYRFTPLAIAAVGLLTLWQLPQLRLRSPLSRSQARLLAFVSLLAATYTTVLYRADYSHLVNTMLPLPFVLTLALRDLPVWSTATWIGRAAMRVAVIAAAMYVYPIEPLLGELYAGLIKPSLVRFGSLPAPAAPPPGDGVAFERATALLSDEPLVAAGSVPMRQFLEEASEVHRLVGDRKTYMTGMATIYTGLAYFMADLRPVPGMLERETMTINAEVTAEVFAEYRRRVSEIECLMVREMEANEVPLFLAAHPGARVEQRPFGGRPVFILLAP